MSIISGDKIVWCPVPSAHVLFRYEIPTIIKPDERILISPAEEVRTVR